MMTVRQVIEWHETSDEVPDDDAPDWVERVSHDRLVVLVAWEDGEWDSIAYDPYEEDWFYVDGASAGLVPPYWAYFKAMPGGDEL